MTTMLGQEKPSLEDLVHHGVKGMKWGVRKSDAPSSSPKLGSSDAGPVIAMGAAYVAIILAMSIRSAKDSGKFNQIKTSRTPWKMDPSLSKKMSVDDLHSKVVAPINKNYGAPGTKMNCRRCTFAYEMRRRGYDVKATNSNYATGQSAKGLHTATNKSTLKTTQSVWGQNQISHPRDFVRHDAARNSKDIFDALGKNPDGARGELGMGWKMGGGHSMAWEIVKGKPIIFDTQSGQTYRDHKAFTTFAGTLNDAAYTRLDNAPLNDAFIRKWAQNA